MEKRKETIKEIRIRERRNRVKVLVDKLIETNPAELNSEESDG